MRFSIHHQVSEDPDVDSLNAVGTIAELTYTEITKEEHTTGRDGHLVAIDVECEQADCEEFIRSMRTFGLLY